MSEEERKKMRLPRFSYQVPDDVAEVFLEEMRDDCRDSAGDLISAILRKYFRARVAGQMLQRFPPLEDQLGKVPDYGPKQPTPKAAQGKAQTAGEP